MILDRLAMALTAAGLVALVTATTTTRQWRQGLGMALDLWMAAGLLRLAGPRAASSLAAAAAVVGVRQVVNLGLRRSHPVGSRRRRA